MAFLLNLKRCLWWPLVNFLHDCWLLDSGASIHISCSLHHFRSYQLVSDKTVTLPNNDVIPIIAISSVCLTNTLILHNFAYIPKFKFNLISVSDLLTNPNLSISFSQNAFDIQEKQACKRIGRGALIQGLYVLDLKDTLDCKFTFPVINSHTNSIPCKNAHIWHSRFGHISDKVFKHLNNKIGLHLSPNFSSSNCFVCPLAKFRRLSFPNSNHLSKLPFDFIHCDIWGPYALSLCWIFILFFEF